MSVADGSSMSASKIFSSHGSRPRKTISNRFSSFLSPKSLHINNFAVDLDNPIKTYGPGDSVKGKVVLDIARPLGVTHVVISLHGHVQVFKNHAKSKSTPSNGAGRAAQGRGKRWVSEYHGDGYMSLFDEEVVLCGEGRLDPAYSPFHFRFNLEFPSKLALPSSIDFERGTIAYVVTATVTRPAYTAATMSCETPVAFLDDIDVGVLPPPKPREVTLRPEQRPGSPRSSLKRLASYDVKRSHHNSTVSTHQSSVRSAGGSTHPNSETASVTEQRVRVPSISSSSSGQNRASIAPSEPRSSHTSPSSRGESRQPLRNITASAELCKSGCLPGQAVPLLVKINHNKIVHNPAGILVTLYRQARVDMHPHLPLASSEKGTNTRYEDYYPRSRTGLGGLSLSAAGSSQVWRKDLFQTTAPLYIDPQTMAQEIKVGIRVPDLPGAFPSIRNVPGQMISFKYIVEVVIDIHGKLIGHDRVLNSSGVMAGAPQPYHMHTSLASSDGGDRTQRTAFESRCMDTTQLRRDKYAVTVECELIVGTRDSHSSKGKQKASTVDLRPVSLPARHESDGRDEAPEMSSGDGWVQRVHPQPKADPDVPPDQEYEWLSKWDEYEQRWLFIDQWGDVYDEDWNFLGYDYGPAGEHDDYYAEPPGLIPPPRFVEEQGISEKEQLRRAEESLLPSRPPDMAQSANDGAENIPSAPTLPEETRYLGAQNPTTAYSGPTFSMVQDFACDTPTQIAPTTRSLEAAASSSRRGGEPFVDLPSNMAKDMEPAERDRLEARASYPLGGMSGGNDESDDRQAEVMAPTEGPGAADPVPVLIQESDAAHVAHEQLGDDALPEYRR